MFVRLLGEWWSDGAGIACGYYSAPIAFGDDRVTWVLGWRNKRRGRPIDGFDERVGGNRSIRATQSLELFPPEGAEEMHSSSLWLDAGGLDKNIGLVSRYAIVLNHERVIWSILEERRGLW